MKKRIAVLLAVLLILGAGVQVYASTVLGTNIIDLIRGAVESIANPIVEEDISKDMDDVMKDIDYQDVLNDYISQKNSQAEADLESHKDAEINRAAGELDAYLDAVLQEIDSAYQNEINGKKQQITDTVNAEIQNKKQDILKELDKILR